MKSKSNTPKVEEFDYDYDRICGIIEALHYLKSEAEKTGNRDIEMLIQSSFNMLVTTYTLLLRNNFQRELSTDDIRQAANC